MTTNDSRVKIKVAGFDAKREIEKNELEKREKILAYKREYAKARRERILEVSKVDAGPYPKYVFDNDDFAKLESIFLELKSLKDRESTLLTELRSIKMLA